MSCDACTSNNLSFLSSWTGNFACTVPIFQAESFHSIVGDLRQDNPESPTELSKFIVSVAAAAVEDEPEPPTFRGTRLNTSHQAGVLHAFNRFRGTCITSLKHCVTDCFRDLERNDTLKGAGLLNVKSWPAGDDLDQCDVEEESSLVDHFRPFLGQNGVSATGVAAYWLRSCCQGAILFLSHYRAQFPNLTQVVEILLIFPMSNAKVERGFSAMRRIKTDWCSLLAENMLGPIKRITIDGCPMKDFDPKRAVQKFSSTARRPDAAQMVFIRENIKT